MKKYFFSFIDDAIWIFRDLTRQRPESMFDHPFFATLKAAHDKWGLKTQINLFYRTDYYYGMDEFNLSEMTDAYKAEWEASSDWLKLGFHSYQEFPDNPHVNASYEDMKKLFTMIRDEVVRFAGEKSFTYGVVPHWIPVSLDGCRALRDCGAEIVCVTAGDAIEYEDIPKGSDFAYSGRILCNRTPEARVFSWAARNTSFSVCGYNHFSDPKLFNNDKVLGYVFDEKTGLKFKKLDDNFDLNNYNVEELRAELERRKNDTLICIGNHEQYFFSDYFVYEPDYSDRIYEMAKILIGDEGRECIFIEDLARMDEGNITVKSL